jgi:hypothetical protein
VTNADQFAFIREIYAEIEDARLLVGDDNAGLADMLNGRGVTSRHGRLWTSETLRKFLASPGA